MRRSASGVGLETRGITILNVMATIKKSSGGGAKVISSKVVFQGPVFRVSRDQVREPGGITSRRDVIRHTGSVVIMAVEDTGGEPRVLLARQYRHAAKRFMLELPAGRIDEGEKPLAAAKRELLEETGYRGSKWKKILYFWPSPGFLDETMTVFVATGLRHGQATPEEDENISTRLYPLSKLVRMVSDGTIQDGKTIASVLWLWNQHRKNME